MNIRKVFVNIMTSEDPAVIPYEPKYYYNTIGKF